MEYIQQYGSEESKDVDSVDKGTHIYGETVSKTLSSLEVYDFMVHILIQSSLGKLPKSSPEEIKQLLNERFDVAVNQHVEPELPEQQSPPIEIDPEQHVRHHLKRQRVDGDV